MESSPTTESRPAGMVILPAYDEAARLPGVLAGLARLELPAEVVVIDDGSRDDTAEVARRLGTTVLVHPFNMGYGAALQTGYKYALLRGASWLVQMDADGQHDPAQIPELVAPLADDRADLVLGSRFAQGGSYAMGPLRNLGRLLFLRVARVFGLTITDPTSGFQAMNKSVLELYTRAFFPSDYPDVDVLLVAHRHRLRIHECAVVMSEGVRPSTLHGGFRTFYYVYRLALALWAGARLGRRAERSRETT